VRRVALSEQRRIDDTQRRGHIHGREIKGDRGATYCDVQIFHVDTQILPCVCCVVVQVLAISLFVEVFMMLAPENIQIVLDDVLPVLAVVHVLVVVVVVVMVQGRVLILLVDVVVVVLVIVVLVLAAPMVGVLMMVPAPLCLLEMLLVASLDGRVVAGVQPADHPRPQLRPIAVALQTTRRSARSLRHLSLLRQGSCSIGLLSLISDLWSEGERWL
jgi:hypothetical protein